MAKRSKGTRRAGKALTKARAQAAPSARGSKAHATRRRTRATSEPVAETAADADPDPVPEPAAAVDAPLHTAVCTSCQGRVTFRSSASGGGFSLVDRDGYPVDAVFGIGRTGLPICTRCTPNGHEEMQLADEQGLVPARDAITRVAAQTNGDAPTQAQLFELAKPFNFEGAWLEIEEKQHDIDGLIAEHEHDAAQAKRSKKALDEAQAALGRLVNTFRARRLQKEREQIERQDRQAVTPAAPEPATAVAPPEPVPATCAYARAHDTPCPVCTSSLPALVLAALESCPTTAFTDRTSGAHRIAAEEVADLGDFDAETLESYLASAEVVAQALEFGSWFAMWEVVETWPPDRRAAAIAWLERGAPAETRPEGIGQPHRAGARGDGGQHCADCGARLLDFGAEGSSLSYPEGSLVGVNCPGAEEGELQDGPAQLADASAEAIP